MLLVFATSDKGGTGRSVTSSNVLYRTALDGKSVCYLDFDFGSPTAGAIFGVESIARGAEHSGLHSYLQGQVVVDEVKSVDIWAESEREQLRTKPAGAGRLVLYPGDKGGGEFPASPEITQRCVRLFQRLQEEYDVCLVDLSAGRSQAVEIVLAATADPALRDGQPFTCRWLIFHRWTRQHLVAAQGLVHGEHGLLAGGVERNHDEGELLASIRYVRTAVVDLEAAQSRALKPPQVAWLQECDRNLRQLARRYRLGRTSVLGMTPLDPVLQWREQLITDKDVLDTQIANQETVDAFIQLAKRIMDDTAWEGL